MLGRWILRWLVVVLVACSLGEDVYAFRPFDSTDAAVAKRGEVEIEFGPIGLLTDDNQRFLVVPATIFNVGVAENWELVVEGRGFVRVHVMPGERRTTLGDTALSVKGVLRRGVLQGGTGPSIATEVGLLLPTVGAEPGSGGSAAAIVSQRWSKVTLHVNGLLALSRDHQLGGLGGAIVEGPSTWRVRPVAEAFLEREPGKYRASGLVGGIWQLSDTVAIDAGVRLATTHAAHEAEIRGGLTWAFALR